MAANVGGIDKILRIVAGAGLIAAAALREEASYFYTPTTLASATIARARRKTR